MSIEYAHTTLLIAQLFTLLYMLVVVSQCYMQVEKLYKIESKLPENTPLDQSNMPITYWILFMGVMSYTIGSFAPMMIGNNVVYQPSLFSTYVNLISLVVGTTTLVMTRKIFLKRIKTVIECAQNIKAETNDANLLDI